MCAQHRLRSTRGIYIVWSQSLLSALWVAKNPNLLHADSEDSDQTVRMPRLTLALGYTKIKTISTNKRCFYKIVSFHKPDDENEMTCHTKPITLIELKRIDFCVFLRDPPKPKRHNSHVPPLPFYHIFVKSTDEPEYLFEARKRNRFNYIRLLFQWVCPC